MADGSGLLDESQLERARAAMPPRIPCVKCGESKPREQFRWQMSYHGRPSRHRSCIDCQYKAQQAHRKFDEGYKERQRRWHRKQYLSLSTEQRAEFIRKCTEQHRARMMRDPEYAAREREKAMLKKREKSTPEQRAVWAAASRKHRDLHPEIRERERLRMKDHRQADIVFYLLRGAKSRAVKYGRDYDLTLDWARARWTGKCELTGIEFDWSRGTVHALSPSLDRIDSSVGYLQENCRFILQAVNAFKGAESDERMLSIARALLQGEPLG
jgi:hypothetical protein